MKTSPEVPRRRQTVWGTALLLAFLLSPLVFLYVFQLQLELFPRQLPGEMIASKISNDAPFRIGLMNPDAASGEATAQEQLLLEDSHPLFLPSPWNATAALPSSVMLPATDPARLFPTPEGALPGGHSLPVALLESIRFLPARSPAEVLRDHFLPLTTGYGQGLLPVREVLPCWQFRIEAAAGGGSRQEVLPANEEDLFLLREDLWNGPDFEVIVEAGGLRPLIFRQGSSGNDQRDARLEELLRELSAAGKIPAGCSLIRSGP